MSFDKELDILDELDQIEQKDQIILEELKNDINKVLEKLKQAEVDSYV